MTLATTLIAPPKSLPAIQSSTSWEISKQFSHEFLGPMSYEFFFSPTQNVYALRPKRYVENREGTILRTFEIVRNREHCLVRAWPFNKVIDQIAL